MKSRWKRQSRSENTHFPLTKRREEDGSFEDRLRLISETNLDLDLKKMDLKLKKVATKSCSNQTSNSKSGFLHNPTSILDLKPSTSSFSSSTEPCLS